MFVLIALKKQISVNRLYKATYHSYFIENADNNCISTIYVSLKKLNLFHLIFPAKRAHLREKSKTFESYLLSNRLISLLNY